MSGVPTGSVGRRPDRIRLWVTVVLLVLFVAALGVLQRRERFWPLVAWNVYDRVRPEVPGTSTSLLEVRATTTDGRTTVLRSQDLVEVSQIAIADLALAGAVTDVDDRTYLSRLVRRVVGDDVETLEVWKVSWRVDVNHSPPLVVAQPSGMQRLATFPASGGSATK
jgi:hypothetical protein